MFDHVEGVDVTVKIAGHFSLFFMRKLFGSISGTPVLVGVRPCATLVVIFFERILRAQCGPVGNFTELRYFILCHHVFIKVFHIISTSC